LVSAHRYSQELALLRSFLRNVCRVACVLLLSAPPAALAQTPDALFRDPPADADRPARLFVVHIPTHGRQINGVIYAPTGTGPHPVVILYHGLPGNEHLARAL
jgi:acetyl esterase/lipase